jgi:ketosteroid isomerase-like protein
MAAWSNICSSSTPSWWRTPSAWPDCKVADRPAIASGAYSLSEGRFLMSDHEMMEKTVREIYAVRNKNDVDAIMRLLGPSCCFQVKGTDRLEAFTQRYDTPEAVRGMIGELVRNWDLSGLETTIYQCGDTVFAHRAGKLTFIATETTVETEILDKITFKDGKVVEFVEFADTYMLAQVAGLG